MDGMPLPLLGNTYRIGFIICTVLYACIQYEGVQYYVHAHVWHVA